NEASPEVARALAESRYSDAMLSVARQERAPGFALGYVMEKEIDATFHGFTLGLNLPIFSSRGKVAAAQAQLAASSAVADQARLNLERKIKADYKKALSLKKQIAAYGPAIALTDNLALIRKAYEMGQCDIDHFFIDMNFFLQAQQNYFDIERQYTSTLLALRNLTR
ncbi:MAG: TolC family protein, partial [Muribaculaceae bacterium]|nr:TolC family protein [Muribaculaceae bacterium]